MDATKKDNIKYYEKYKQLTSYTNMTKEKFEKEYKKFFDDETKTKEFYLLILSELEKAVSKGDIDIFKKLNNFIGYINDIERKAILKDFYDSKENPIKNSNLVILACKHNKVEILTYIFNNGILNNLSLDIGRSAVTFNDQDEACHNAFYYSMQSNNVELLDTLINKWPGNYLATHSEQLDEILSSAYKELKLKNVSLSIEIQIYTEKKLINDYVKKRIELVLQSINLLKTEYPNTKKLDKKFLYVIKFIAQNVHILKRSLKSTYDKIPWEEIEFCLVSFISSHVKQQDLSLFYRAVLNKRKVFDYLKNFAQILGNLKELEMFTDFPKGKRQEIVSKIISNCPQFVELYTDYQQIRDICSLQKMKNYVQLALLINPVERHGQLIITRILQVIGKHLNNSLESPKLSDFRNKLLLLSLPKNTRKIVMDLRDSPSRAHSSESTEIEKNTNVEFFTDIQDDIKKIGDKVNIMLQSEKTNVIKTLYEKIKRSKCLNEIKEVAEAFVNINNEFDVIEKFHTMECSELGIIIKEVNNSITERTEDEQKLFDKIQRIINEKFVVTLKFALLQCLSQYLSNDNK